TTSVVGAFFLLQEFLSTSQFRISCNFIILCLLTQAHGVWAQRNAADTLIVNLQSDSLSAYSVPFNVFLSPKEDARQVNDLDGIHRYYPHLRVSPVRNDLGNLGSAEHVVLFDFNRPFGFRFTDSRPTYFRKVQERCILLSDKAFSNVYYVNGQNAENQLHADFTRAFGNMFNAGFHFGRINSKGYYGGQQNVLTDLSVYAAFNSRNSRYRGRLIFDWQDVNVSENGGIANDSVFDFNLTSGRSFIPTNLSNASNQRVGFDLGLEQQFALPRMWLSDSTYYSRRFIPVVEHSFSLERYSNVYRDVPVANGFYENIFRDSSVTNDSTFLLGVTNVLRLRLYANDSSAITSSGVLGNVFAGIGHRYDQVDYDSISYNAIHNVFLDLGSDGILFRRLKWWAKDRFMLIGRNVLDNRFEGGLAFSVGTADISADVTYHAFRPDYMTENYISNHFIISNDFGKTNHLTTGFRFSHGRLRTMIDARYHLLQNLVVFGLDRLPFQSKDVNQLVVVRMKQQATLRWFHLDIDAAVQFKLSGDDIRVPMVLGRGMVYYQNDLFKRKLRIQVGYEVSYASAYFANAYNPALSAFHLQNYRQVGNYPFMDFFLNIRIKTFQGFFKMEHWNAGLMGYRYYHVPHHPANDMAWKFGVRWAFLD
ncbi:MAG: putative porin, partial [Flavobacteriales bacterium]|nr:putative porin [Flavobacteriales bacterium]